MANMVGLSRNIKIEWLNKTVDLVLDNKNYEEIKSELNEYLSYEINSPTNLRKSRDILLRIWAKTPDEYLAIRNKALETYKQDNVNKLAIHWCMILLTYPIFIDINSLIGKVSNLQDTFTISWLKDKVYEVWGERTTLLHSIDKILQTLNYIGAIERIKPGIYKIKKYEITDYNTIDLMLSTIIKINQNAYYEISNLNTVPYMYSFKYEISHEWIHKSSEFELSNINGKVVINSK